MRTETISWAVRGAGLAVGVGFVLLLAFLAGAARDVLLLVFLAVLLGAALEPRGRRDPGPHRDRPRPVDPDRLRDVPRRASSASPCSSSRPRSSSSAARSSACPSSSTSVRAWSATAPAGGAGGRRRRAASTPSRRRSSPAGRPTRTGSSACRWRRPGRRRPDHPAGARLLLADRALAPPALRPGLPARATGAAGIRDAWNEVESRLGLWVRGQLVLMATIGDRDRDRLQRHRAAGRAPARPDRGADRGHPDRRPAHRRRSPRSSSRRRSRPRRRSSRWASTC